MLYTFDFNTEAERGYIIAEQTSLGYRFKEEQRYFDGNHLIFTDEPYPKPEPVRDLEAEIDELKAGQGKINNKLNTLLRRDN